MDARVRRSRADEWEALRELRLRALASDPSAFGSTLERERALPEEQWRARADPQDERVSLVAEDARDGRLVGMAGAWREPETRDVELYGMWVAPEARGSGAARGLIQAVVEWARARGAQRVTLWVNAANARAIRVYEREGFAPLGEPVQGTRDPSRWFLRMGRAP